MEKEIKTDKMMRRKEKHGKRKEPSEREIRRKHFDTIVCTRPQTAGQFCFAKKALFSLRADDNEL